MAISIANTLTSRLWKGEPKVVIRGKFVLGLVTYGNRAYFAPNLSLGDPTRQHHIFADPLVPGTSISVQLLGRSVPYNMSADGPVLSSLPDFGQGCIYSFDDYYGYTSYPEIQELFPSDPYGNGAKDMFFAPKVYFQAGNHLSNRDFQLDNFGEGDARYVTSDLGQLVARNLRIVVRGALSSLDITGIAAIGFPPNGSPIGYTAASTPWYSQYYYANSDFSPGGVGWRATDVHIYDNPGLRGHVTAGDVPVIWE